MSLSDDLETSERFRILDNQLDMRDVAERLVEEHPALEEHDLTIQNHQLTKAGMLKLLLYQEGKL